MISATICSLDCYTSATRSRHEGQRRAQSSSQHDTLARETAATLIICFLYCGAQAPHLDHDWALMIPGLEQLPEQYTVRYGGGDPGRGSTNRSTNPTTTILIDRFALFFLFFFFACFTAAFCRMHGMVSRRLFSPLFSSQRPSFFFPGVHLLCAGLFMGMGASGSGLGLGHYGSGIQGKGVL